MDKCASYRAVSLMFACLIELFYENDTFVLSGHVKVSVLERCPSYGISVLRGVTVPADMFTSLIFFIKPSQKTDLNPFTRA